MNTNRGINLSVAAFGAIILLKWVLIAVIALSPHHPRISGSNWIGHQYSVRDVKSISAPIEEEQTISEMISDICAMYSLDPQLVFILIQRESGYNPEAISSNGGCIGLMQISTKWHSSRAERLCVTDLFDPYGNILTGCDYLHELFEKYEDPRLVLMLWHMRHDKAFELYSQGIVDKWSMSILREAEVV